MTHFKKFDVAEHLNDADTIAAYLTEAFESDDAAIIARSIGTVARSKGMAAVADRAGVSRESLYKSLNGQSKPEFETIRKVLAALGVRLVAEAVTETDAVVDPEAA
ncbi:putative addiction module antidote protein [Tardiphaga alba]|uniref:Addiction module antidote protein n=1 Tax=Tardiphaga alba TaxID=340268 RepID=A0ABX8ADM9_9BRAD|nr:addiction module antidote protein [Tardiphaga alba]QUS40744.1 putative addiction module antidote protein [Tardiphaga alba]